jgi:NADPH:quinone reductase-like Zn-dependent oxidoreductase
MRAVTFTEYGAPSVLQVRDLPEPRLGATEVLLRVYAAEVTKSDCELRAMRFPVKWFSVPLRLVMGWNAPRKPVLGAYLAGVVAAVGSGVTKARVGDEVYGSSGMRFGAYAEYVNVAEAATLVAKPRNLTFAQAAAIPLGGLNALHFMDRAAIRPGERVLIIGAGGSIGSFALQIAKRRGAHVTAVDASHKLAWLRELGADAVVDYSVTDALSEAAAFDVIFSTIAGKHYARCLRALKPRGRYLTANPRFAELLRWKWTNLTTDKRVVVAFAQETRAQLDTLREMAERGEITVPIDGVFALHQASAAHTRVETEQRLGAVVLDVAGTETAAS